ncbi:MAG: hypothetical protein AAF694_02935 [Bacteroidota bacterium]
MGKIASGGVFSMGVFISIFMVGCGSNQQKTSSPLQLAFSQQLSRSCVGEGKLFHKVVSDLSKDNPKPDEIKLDTLSSSDLCPIEEELSFLLEQSYDDPTLRDKFQEEIRGDTLVVSVLPSESQNAELQFQKIVRNEAEQIQYLETYWVSTSWLYKTQLNAWVKFDSSGLYQSHQIQSYMEVATVGNPFHARIKGNIETYE